MLHDPSFKALHKAWCGLRSLCSLAAVSQTGCGGTRSSEGAEKTSWDFSHDRSRLTTFMKATERAFGRDELQHHSCLDVQDGQARHLSPADPNKVFWDYEGTELRDPTMKELAGGYYSRLLSWYTKRRLRGRVW